MRTNSLLETLLDSIWQDYFSDVPRSNKVSIKFGKRAKRRLGSIRKINNRIGSKNFETEILINGYFRDKTIPQYVIEATIAHELSHYAHGFSSPLPKLSRFPHRGGMVDKELVNRGLKYLADIENSWLKNNWAKYLRKHNLY